MIKKISTKYLLEETGITFTLDCKDRITIRTSNEDQEFIFKNSNRETIKKIGNALINISSYNE